MSFQYNYKSPSNALHTAMSREERESSRVRELSRDVHDACVESSLARTELIEPLRWGMAQIHIGSQNVLWIVQTLDTSGKDNDRGLDGCGC